MPRSTGIYIKIGIASGIMVGWIVAFIQLLNALIFFSFFESHVKALALHYLISPFVLYMCIFAFAGGVLGALYGTFMRKRPNGPSTASITGFLYLFLMPVYILLVIYWYKFTESHVSVAPFFTSPARSFGIVAMFMAIWFLLMRAILMRLFVSDHGRISTILWIGIIFSTMGGLILYKTQPQDAEREQAVLIPEASMQGQIHTNVLLVTIDTLRRDYLGCYGNDLLKTPVIDALAARGVKFTNPVCHTPITLPSHTSILTSKYPISHGVRSNARFKVNPQLVTLPEILQQTGYRTAAFVSALVLDSVFGLNQGFTVYDDSFNTTEEKMLLVLKNRISIYRLLEKLGIMQFPQLEEAERNAEEVTEAAIAWLKENRDRPFFLWVHYFDPHAPLLPPEPYRSRQLEKIAGHAMSEQEYDLLRYKALYRAEIEFTDNQIGRLFNFLEKRGEMQHTLVVMTADHGQSISEHGYLGHTDTVHYTTINSPLILACPTLLPEGKTIEAMARLVDVMPTILDLLDIDSDIEMDGRSLVPLICGEGAEEGRLVDVSYAETMYRKDPAAQYVSLQTDSWKFIRNLDGSRQELYRIKDDPEEKLNLAANYPKLVDRFNKELQESIRVSRLQADTITVDPGSRIKEGLKRLGYLE